MFPTGPGRAANNPRPRSGKGLSDGVVSELATFFTVKPGHEEELRATVRRLTAKVAAWANQNPPIHFLFLSYSSTIVSSPKHLL